MAEASNSSATTRVGLPDSCWFPSSPRAPLELIALRDAQRCRNDIQRPRSAPKEMPAERSPTSHWSPSDSQGVSPRSTGGKGSASREAPATTPSVWAHLLLAVVPGLGAASPHRPGSTNPFFGRDAGLWPSAAPGCNARPPVLYTPPRATCQALYTRRRWRRSEPNLAAAARERPAICGPRGFAKVSHRRLGDPQASGDQPSR